MKNILNIALLAFTVTTTIAQLPIQYLDRLNVYAVDENGDESLTYYTTYHYDELFRDTLEETYENELLTYYAKKWYEGNTTWQNVFEIDPQLGTQNYLFSIEYDDSGRVIKRYTYDTATSTPEASFLIQFNYDGEQLASEEWFNSNGNGLELFTFVTYTYDENDRLVERYSDFIGGDFDTWNLYEYDANGNIVKEQKDRIDGTTGQRYTFNLTTYAIEPNDTILGTSIAFSSIAGDTADITLDTTITIEQDRTQTTSVKYIDNELTAKRVTVRAAEGYLISSEESNFNASTQTFVPESASENIFDENISTTSLAAPYYQELISDFPYKLLEQRYYGTNDGAHEYRMVRREELVYKSVITSTTEELSAVKIFPNPATDFVNVEGVSLGSQYTIIDRVGRLLDSGRLTSERIQVSDLPTGYYVLTIDSNNGLVTAPIIKMK